MKPRLPKWSQAKPRFSASRPGAAVLHNKVGKGVRISRKQKIAVVRGFKPVARVIDKRADDA
jgi:hypothetical protein